MREKYESLSAIVLKDLAKARGLKNVSNMRKKDLVELMLSEDERLLREKQETQEKQEIQEKPVRETTAKEEPLRNQTAGRPRRGAANNREMSPRENQGRESGRETAYRDRDASPRENQGRDTASRERDMSQGRESGRETAYRDRDASPRENQGRDTASRERDMSQGRENQSGKDSTAPDETLMNLDSGISANGILEVMPDGYGFIRCANYLPGENDVYVSPSQIRKFNLKTGDIICGNTRVKTQQEKFSALLYVTTVNGFHPGVAQRRKNFEDLTPIFPNRRIRMEHPGCSVAMRVVDLVSPVGKGQRGMIVSQPKAGKTTLLKEIAKSVTRQEPQMHLIILLIDERPEEVTDIKEAIEGENVEVIYSTFDELPEHHKRVSEMVIERAKRLVEHGRDVMILLDSITRLARAYNLTVPPSGRTLSGGLDPAALHMPKRFFGAARNMREGGSLTILATALVDTGSKMDDVVYEEFKGTGNMELVLDRKLSEKRIFPAIDIVKSGTRREDLLLDPEEQDAVDIMRKAINGMRTDDAVENILNLFARTRTNMDFIYMVKKTKLM
ncbi:MAG: transcription termination factor Rho [Roseburia sp.]|jgi:transcription termination factor Rho|nr:transcription termination factor Rho [Roseburia sp.]